MQVLLWNLEWAERKACRETVTQIVSDTAPDVICLTEVTPFLKVDAANVIVSQGDYGYPNPNGDRHKVWLWSASTWTSVDTFGNADLPPGRFASGVTQGIRFVGVCIPWYDAHVSKGNRNRKQWEDHIAYINALQPLLASYARAETPVCILGDFNQRIPPTKRSQKAYTALRRVLDPRFTIHTAGMLDADGELLIDHVATTANLSFRVEEKYGRRTTAGKAVSDHGGMRGTLEDRRTPGESTT